MDCDKQDQDEVIAVKLIREYAHQYAGASDIFADKHQAAESMKHFLEHTYKKESEYVRKNGIRAVIYLLFTKMILAILFEIPIDLWLIGKIAFVSLAINIIFHPLLLLFITRRPLGFSADNTEKATAKALGIIDGHVNPIYVKVRKKTPYELAYFLLYGLLYAVTFGIIIGALHALDFNPVSMILFLVFLALVSYFGVRIRSHALRYKVSTGKEKILSMLGNLFMLPIVRMGRYLSTKFSTINALVFIMDFIIETPFKLMLKVFNDFLYFLRDKREDVF
ncbi:MAG TPA: hypothetical protein VEC13_00950 [Candidatus Paceibacterota bacterium]|nr:hypothetical protein [Candidatus Paceibacterota bacterium]